MPLAERASPAWLLAPVLALAALIRFAALAQRGFIYWDEAKFVLEGLRLQTELRALLGAPVSLAAGKTVGTAKPTHALLIALSYALLGVHDYAPLFLDAAASVVEVALVYLIGRRLFSPAVGLIAALFLAVSEYDVIYARSALSETDANALLLAGVLLWLCGPRRSRMTLAAGLLMGLAFTTNYRLIVYIAAIVLVDLVWRWRQRDWRWAVQGILPWGAGLAIAPLLWQVIDVVARARGVVLFRNEITGRPAWYLLQVFYQIHQGKQSVLHFGPLPYLAWYVTRQGWPMAVLLLLALALTVRYRSFPWLATAAPIVLPYAVYAFAPFIVPRNLDAAVPFAAVLSAAGLTTAARSIPAERLAAGLLLLAVALSGATGGALAWRLTAERSGFARAATYILDHHRRRALASSEIMMFYLRGADGQCTVPRVPHTLSQLPAALHTGYRYAVLDQFNWGLAKWIHRHMPLAVRYPTIGRVDLGENPISSENGDLPGTHLSPSYVYVFRLVPSAVPPSQRNQPVVCHRDTV